MSMPLFIAAYRTKKAIFGLAHREKAFIVSMEKFLRNSPQKTDFLPVFGHTDFYNATSKSNTVWSMLQDKKGTIWFGTGEGVYCFDGKAFSRFLDNPNVINKNNLALRVVSSILEDKNGTIWFASGCPPGGEGIGSYDGKI